MMCCDYDFSCWVIRYDRKSINGKFYRNDTLTNHDRLIVPLLWNHQHFDTDSVLGTAVLENRPEGIFAYCTFNNSPSADTARTLIDDKGTVSISPYLNRVKYSGNFIVNGVIREVSLVYERVDPDELYYPVINKEEE